MDMKPYMSGLIAITASALTAGAVLCGQVISQRHEDVRHLRALAYQSALDEWKTRVKTISDAEMYQYLPHFSDYLLQHMEYSSVVLKYGPGTGGEKYAGETLDTLLNEFRRRQKRLNANPNEGEDKPE